MKKILLEKLYSGQIHFVWLLVWLMGCTGTSDTQMLSRLQALQEQMHEVNLLARPLEDSLISHVNAMRNCIHTMEQDTIYDNYFNKKRVRELNRMLYKSEAEYQRALEIEHNYRSFISQWDYWQTRLALAQMTVRTNKSKHLSQNFPDSLQDQIAKTRMIIAQMKGAVGESAREGNYNCRQYEQKFKNSVEKVYQNAFKKR